MTIDAARDAIVDADGRVNLRTFAASYGDAIGERRAQPLLLERRRRDAVLVRDAGQDMSDDDVFTTAVALADLDNDGDLDLVTGSFAQSVRSYINDGSGGFGGATILPVIGDGIPEAALGFCSATRSPPRSDSRCSTRSSRR